MKIEEVLDIVLRKWIFNDLVEASDFAKEIKEWIEKREKGRRVGKNIVRGSDIMERIMF